MSVKHLRAIYKKNSDGRQMTNIISKIIANCTSGTQGVFLIVSFISIYKSRFIILRTKCLIYQNFSCF